MHDAASVAPNTFPEAPGGDRLLSISDVCRTVGRGKTWIMEASRAGSFPEPTKIAGRLFWSHNEVQKWIAECLAERRNECNEV